MNEPIRVSTGPYQLSQAEFSCSFHGPYMPRWTPFPRDIVREVAKRNGLTVEEMLSPSRVRRLSWARQEAMRELRDRTRLSLPQIARLLNRGDHTTVIHGLRAFEKRRLEAQ